MIVLLDVGLNNLSSVQSGFARAGADTLVVKSAEEWEKEAAGNREVSGVVLPGVGAFGDAMFQLRATGLLGVVRRAAKEGYPLLGICLGMQLLFSMSEEHGSHMGIGLLPGRVVRFTGDYKIPHMGWNSLDYLRSHPLLEGIKKGDYVYFVHSLHAVLQEESHLLAATEYAGVRVSAVVGRDNILGTQFHPEKSGPVGEQILRNFVGMCAAWHQGRGVGARV